MPKEKQHKITLKKATGIHSLANQVAQSFFDKRKENKKPHSLVNKHFSTSEKKVNHKKKIYSGNIHYNDLPYVHQPRVNDCADTVVAMLLKYNLSKNNKVTEKPTKNFLNKFNQRKNNRFFGKTEKDILKYSSLLQFNDLKKERNSITIQQLAYHLYQNGPIIASTKQLGGHFIIIKGVVKNEIIYHDPWFGPNQICSLAKFKKRWDGSKIQFIAGFSTSSENLLSKAKFS